MNKSIERLISQICSIIFKQIFTAKSASVLTNNDKSAIEQNMLSLETSQKFQSFVQLSAQKLATKGVRGQKGIWRQFYEKAKKAHYIGLPKTWNAYEAQVMTNAISHNFQMIKSIPSRMMEVFNHKYTSTLIEEVAKGNLPRGSFRQMLQKHGATHAQLIARTETAKLQTTILEDRATTLGSVAYEWLSSRDRRTRPSHQMMNGVIVFWRPNSDKPKLDGMQGNAGEYPNCRCSPEPIVDINELTQSHYKVYDYRYHKIITMTKKELIEALTKGSL